MTSQEPQTPIPVDAAAILDTEVIAVAQPSPVFVDSTGRRRRVLRRVAYGFGALCMLYGGLVSVSLAGGPVSSSAVLPLPELADGDRGEAVVARPTPTPEPITATPSRRPVLEVLPRRNAPVTGHTAESGTVRRSTNPTTRPERSAAPEPTTKKPATKPTTPRPAESGTTKPTSPAPTKPTTDDPATPIPPAPPATGGEGGGTGTPISTDDDATGSGSGGGGGTTGDSTGTGTDSSGSGGSNTGGSDTGEPGSDSSKADDSSQEGDSSQDGVSSEEAGAPQAGDSEQPAPTTEASL